MFPARDPRTAQGGCFCSSRIDAEESIKNRICPLVDVGRGVGKGEPADGSSSLKDRGKTTLPKPTNKNVFWHARVAVRKPMHRVRAHTGGLTQVREVLGDTLVAASSGQRGDNEDHI